MATLILTFRRWARALRRWLSSKEQPGLAVNLEAVQGSTADYRYIFDTLTVNTNPTGDTYEVVTFKVVKGIIALGTMTIAHNRFGAFASFQETRKYPLA